MTSTSTSNNLLPLARVACLPLKVELPVRAMQPMAAALASTASQWADATRDDLLLLIVKKQEAVDIAQECSDISSEILNLQIERFQSAFTILKHVLILKGKLLEANLVSIQQLTIWKSQEKIAHDELMHILKQLGLVVACDEETRLPNAGELLHAFVRLQRAQQKVCQNHLHDLWARRAELHSHQLLEFAATCLVEIAEMGLEDVLYFDEIPTSLETNLAALELAKTYPFAGVWPSSAA